jgi:hypothetical protein
MTEEIDYVETIVAWLNRIGYSTHRNIVDDVTRLFWGENDTEAEIHIFRRTHEIYLYTHHTHLSMVVDPHNKEQFNRLVFFLESYAKRFREHGGNVVPGNFRI